jgi:diacylglycerol O-acyltransferase
MLRERLQAWLDDDARMGSVDRAWLRMDDPANLMIVNTLILLAEPLSRTQLRELVHERLAWIRRMRLQVARGRVWDRWTEQPLELDEHVREHLLPSTDEASLRALVSELISTPLALTRPLWELHIIQQAGRGSAILARVHHSVGDGLALLLVLLSLTDLERAPSAENPLRALFGQRGSVREGVERARSFVREVMPTGMKLMLHEHPPIGLARLTAAVARDLATLLLRRPDSHTVFRGRLDVRKRVAWSRPIPLAELRSCSHRLGSTVNDVLLAATSGGLRRYILARGDSPDGIEMRAAVPVNLRGLAELARLGNRFGLVFLELPVGIADPRARLVEIHRRMDALKHSVEPLVTWGILELMGSSPKLVERLILDYFAKRVSFVMTNVPGPERRLYLAGREITGLMFWVPQSGRVGLGVSMFSYAGTVRLGIACDARLVPDPEALIDSFHAELEDLLSEAQSPSSASSSTRRPTSNAVPSDVRRISSSSRP